MENYVGSLEWECTDFRIDIQFQVSSPSTLDVIKSPEHPKNMMTAALDMVRVNKANRTSKNGVGSFRFKYTFNAGDVQFLVDMKIKPLSDVLVQIKDNYQSCLDRIDSSLAIMINKQEKDIVAFKIVDIVAGSGGLSLN